MAFGIGENSEFFPLTCAVASSSMAAISYFDYLANKFRGDKTLVDCMSKYARNSDNVTREMQLYTEMDGITALINISIVKAVTADGYPF
jgi:hypothetical protein